MHVDAAVHRLSYVTFMFEDDPFVTAAMRRGDDGESVVVTPRKRDDGVWTFHHDIRLRGG